NRRLRIPSHNTVSTISKIPRSQVKDRCPFRAASPEFGAARRGAVSRRFDLACQAFVVTLA
ncbi:hypothetical protein, partial [Azospirillum aestuarii]|uniref:hypothetical protein n=1 Tax=Azospirillum aestuarii TaxID=2802052 RepID=UPI001B3B977D